MSASKTSPAEGRTRYDEKTKREVVEKILAGKLKAADAQRQFGLQSYQLHAWIGYTVLQQIEEGRYSSGPPKFEDTTTIRSEVARAAISGDQTDDDRFADIVAWFIRREMKRREHQK